MALRWNKYYNARHRMNGKALLVLVAFATSAMLIGGGSTGLASPLATNSTGNGNGNSNTSSSGGLTTTNTDGGEANTIDAGPAYVMFNNLPRAADAWRFSRLVRRDVGAARSTSVDAGPD